MKEKLYCQSNVLVAGGLYLVLALIILLGVKSEVQAAVLPPMGEEYGSLISLREVSAWDIDNLILNESHMLPVTLVRSDSPGDALRAVTALFPAMTAEDWKMSISAPDRSLERFDRSLVLFGGIVPANVRPPYASVVDLGSSSPVKPISPSPTSAVLFVPAVIGLLGVLLRERSSLKMAESEDVAVCEQATLSSTSILILSSEPAFAASVQESLHRAGHAVHLVGTVDEAVTSADRSSPSLIVLDHRVTEWDMLRTHPTLKQTPIMTLIPRGNLYTEEQVISDLDRGADGFHDFRDGYRLFVAKVEAYLRRSGHDMAGRGIYQVGAVELDADIHEVRIAGQRLQLSAKPFAILKTLMQAPSRVFSRSELVDRVWGPQFAIGEHTLDVHVHALRQQLDRDPNRLCQLVTIKGVGFKLRAVGSVPLESGPKVEQIALSMSRTDQLHLEYESHAAPLTTQKRVVRRRAGNMTRRPAAAPQFGYAALAV